MKTLIYLMIAIVCNALGTALMNQTALGLSAWGSSARNVANYFNLSLGVSFILIATLFYGVALIILKEFQMKTIVYSMLFLISFGFITDFFILILPAMETSSILIRIVFNTLGLCILLFGITLHLRVNIAVHPMDVFMQALRKLVNSVTLGTYLTYGIAFLIAIVFGLLDGQIEGIHVGTINTVLLGGLLVSIYDRYIVMKYMM